MSNRLFAHEKAWVDAELALVNSRIKELGLELGEAMDQSSETWHDNGPADAIMNEVGALWSKHAWLSSQAAKMVREYPQHSQCVEIGHVVTVDGNGTALRLFLGNITMPMPKTKAVGPEAPLHILLLGKKPGDSIAVGSTIYELNTIEIY